jgi:cell wall-associated NlpC family hydrolase
MISKWLIFIFCSSPVTTFTELALVVVPVIDLISTPASSLCKKVSAQKYYQQIPLSPVNPGKDLYAGPRQHQALFNEVVDIIETTTNEVKVKALNAYYLNIKTGQKFSNFWTLKKNLIPLKKINKKLLPAPINYQQTMSHAANTITLTTPWHCPQTNQTFSAGTRFKVNSRGSAYCYQASQNKFILINIPKQFFIPTKKRNHAQQRKALISIIKQWAHSINKLHIPYTWGGCSFIQRVPTHNTKSTTQKYHGRQRRFYQAVNKKPATETGMDCSGLVLRATQTVGIPYYYKNSSTLAHELPDIKKNEAIKPGDLIWLSGHVIIIADPAKNLCIEARDFGHGYGKVQLIHIKKLFKNISNFTQLKDAFHGNKLLTRIDKKGNVRRKYRIKILKLL